MESEFSFDHQYSLRWNEYHTKLVSSFQSLQKSDDFVDVTIACEDRSFTAHKVVLSACSPYFCKLLKANPCQHPIIILQTVRSKHFESLLNFMYNGVVHIEPEQLHDFLRTANSLHVLGLSDIQFPSSFNRKNSTDSEPLHLQAMTDSGEDRMSSPKPTKKMKRDEQKSSTAQDKAQNVASMGTTDLTNIDKIIDTMHEDLQPIANPPLTHEHQSEESTDVQPCTPKLEPIEDLIIDEDAFDNDTSDRPEHRSENPSFSGSVTHLQDQFTSKVMSMSESFINMKKYRSDCGGTESNTCIVCKRNYSSPSNLRAHVLNVHIQTSKKNWFECQVCGKKCKTKHYLINHEMQKHGIRQRSKRPSYLDCINEDTL